MNRSWRNNTVTGVALFLECCALYLVFVAAAALLKQPGIALPFWLVLLALVLSFVLMSYMLSVNVNPRIRGLMGLATWVDPDDRVQTSPWGCWMDCTRSEAAFYTGVTLGLLGGLAGFVIGDAIESDVWQPVPKARSGHVLRPTLGPSGAGVRLSILTGPGG